MIENYKQVIGKYTEFTGRARRQEYWYFVLANILIYIALGIVGGIIGYAINEDAAMMVPMVLIGLFVLAIFLPSLAVAVRRLHDTGRSGWWYLIALVPYVGGLVLLVFFCLDSEPGTNKWGPNPKTGALATDLANHLVD